jgi:hypothetical protein
MLVVQFVMFKVQYLKQKGEQIHNRRNSILLFYETSMIRKSKTRMNPDVHRDTCEFSRNSGTGYPAIKELIIFG